MKKRYFLARIIPIIIIVAVTIILSAVMYNQMVEVEKETCWERLEIATESTAQKIQLRLNDNISFLEAVSDSYILRNHIDHEAEIGKYLTSVRAKTIFESIELILPDIVITQEGESLDFIGDMSYDELVKLGKHISPRLYDDALDAEVLYCFMPIEDNGIVSGLLCGKLKCETLSEIFEVTTYKGDAQIFLIDCNDGNYLIDNWHGKLGNINDNSIRIGIDGKTIIDIAPAILNRESGRMAFISNTNGMNSYQYYTPVQDYNWELCVLVQENIVFEKLNDLKTYLLFVGGIEFLLIVVVILWNVLITVSGIKSEEKANALELTRATNEAKSRFISNMSHDIRTPLNGIVGMLHIIKTHRDDKVMVDDCLDKIEISTQYLSTLTSDLLDINEIESNKLVLEENPINLHTLASDVSVMIEPKAKDVGVRCKFDSSAVRNPYVKGSTVHIERVLVNLISNAIKYSKGKDGKVDVIFEETEHNGDTGIYRFIVKDNGVGISEDFKKKMYNAFAQERQGARSSYEGYGLGLTIVRRLVEKMGGSIDLESIKGEGSTFVVTLPLKSASEADYESTVKHGENTKLISLEGVRVLLVEDNEFNREIAEVILKDAGAEIVTAENGRIATEIFEKSEHFSFDLVLMDIMMPEIDGYEATQIIRSMKRPDAQTVPVFAMTAHTFTEEIRRCKQVGMNEHIAKPLNVDNLLEKAAKYCKKCNK